jgi:hypothetical protein
MPDVTVKLTIGSFSVEVSGEPDFVNKKFEELVSRFLTGSSPSTAEMATPAVALETSGKRTSPAEFLKQAAAKSQFDRALLLGYYLEKTQGVSSFTSAEITQLGQEAKQPFANSSDAIAKLTGRGLMMSAGDKDGKRAFALTASGEAYVEGLVATKQ